MKTYSIKKGLKKGAITFLTVAGTWVAFTGFSDVQLWVLAESYLKPVLGSMTVGVAITMTLNYIKVKFA